MREVNLAGLDLNLLPALEALLRRRNVTHAAADVGLSQPAMSRALARLRETFGDPLLIRAGGGLAPTPLARSLAPKVAAALDELRGLFRAEDFDPSALHRAIRLAGGDAQTILLAPRLIARLQREAPGVDLRIEPIDRDILGRMERAEVDLCFATAATPLPPGAFSEPLASDRLALVMRRGHPAANRTWSLADYAAYPHATVAFFADGLSEIDARLAARGRRAAHRADDAAFHGDHRRGRGERPCDHDLGGIRPPLRRAARSRPEGAAVRRHARSYCGGDEAARRRPDDAMVPQGAA